MKEFATLLFVMQYIDYLEYQKGCVKYQLNAMYDRYKRLVGRTYQQDAVNRYHSGHLGRSHCPIRHASKEYNIQSCSYNIERLEHELTQLDYCAKRDYENSEIVKKEELQIVEQYGTNDWTAIVADKFKRNHLNTCSRQRMPEIPCDRVRSESWRQKKSR